MQQSSNSRAGKRNFPGPFYLSLELCYTISAWVCYLFPRLPAIDRTQVPVFFYESPTVRLGEHVTIFQ